MEGPAIFWIRSIPGPGKQRLSYGKLVRRQPELRDAIIWKKNKNAKKKNSKQPWQTNKALSTHAMVAQAKGEGCLRRSQLLRRGGRNLERSLVFGCIVVFWQTKLFFSRRPVGNITNNLKSWSQNLATPNTFKLLKLCHLAKREYVTDFQTKYVVELTAQRLTLTCCLRNRTRW